MPLTLMDKRTESFHYAWTEKWGAGQWMVATLPLSVCPPSVPDGDTGEAGEKGIAGLAPLPLVANRLASPRLQFRSMVTMLRPATSIRINGRLATSRATFSTVTAPIPRFRASVTSLRSGTSASRMKHC